MTEQQIPKLVGQLVEHQQVFSALSNADAQFVIQYTTDAIALFVDAVKNRAKQAAQKLLQFVSSIKVETVKLFIVKDHFKVGETESVKISWLGANFKENFLKVVEDTVEACDLKIHRLTEYSLDPPIIAELGEAHETKLAYLWQLLKKQPKGEEGALLTNGYANIFYVRGKDGVLCAVSAHWHGDGWHVHTDSIESPLRWNAGAQVFSR